MTHGWPNSSPRIIMYEELRLHVYEMRWKGLDLIARLCTQCSKYCSIVPFNCTSGSMRCLKTRSFLVLLTVMWLLGVCYFLNGLKSSKELQRSESVELGELDTYNNEELDQGKSTAVYDKVSVLIASKKANNFALDYANWVKMAGV